MLMKFKTTRSTQYQITILSILFVLLQNGMGGDTEDSTSTFSYPKLEDIHHVMLKPAENLTVHLVTPRTIFLSWDPPDIYVVHDVNDPDEISEGDRVTASKMQDHMTLVGNETSGTVNKVGKSFAKYVGQSNKFVSAGIKRVFKWLSLDTWDCKPFSFFANYTVELQGANLTAASPVTLQESHWATHRESTEYQDSNPVVPFREGCLKNYKIVWQEIGEDKLLRNVQSMIVNATERTAKIEPLKPNTWYRISVIAQFFSTKEVSTHPFILVNTSASDDENGNKCKCDWHGTMGDQLSCNMSAADADSGQGLCACKPEYEGAFCDRCKPGFYRTKPFFPCHKCPCNMHGTGISTCGFVEGFLRCHKCEVGYRGSLCHACDRGFYRYNKYCIPCHCHGNVSPNARAMCLPTTGQCLNCAHNTTGFKCERCQPGYMGDAIVAKNCTLIDEVKARQGSQSLPTKSESGGLSAGVVITIIMLLLLMIAAVGFIALRKYLAWQRRRSPGFWTVGMSPGDNAVDINSVHNNGIRFNGQDEDDYDDDDALGGNMEVDDVEFYNNKGGVRSGNNKYLRLREEA